MKIGDKMEKNPNLLRFEKFFRSDLEIKKKLLIELVPTHQDIYDEESLAEYIEKLIKNFHDIKSKLLTTIDDFTLGGEEAKQVINENFQKMEEKLLYSRREYDNLKKLYEECCSNLDDKIIDEVKKEFCGYKLFRGSVYNLLKESNSINEMLHIIHASITNNENYYSSLPKLAQKENNLKEPITFYGIETDLGKYIFDSFPPELNCGITSVVALEECVLMMVRDVGHALQIEINVDENEEVWIQYFIPKVCNVEMVNQLKGINKIKDDSKGAKGLIRTTKEQLTTDLYELIAHVPKDADMVIEPIYFPERQLSTVQQTQPMSQTFPNFVYENLDEMEEKGKAM